jgi:hypothetical protein
MIEETDLSNLPLGTWVKYETKYTGNKLKEYTATWEVDGETHQYKSDSPPIFGKLHSELSSKFVPFENCIF